VVDLLDAVSGTRKVLFAASKETPLETHCYSVQLDAANSPVGEPTMLTSAGSTHAAGDVSPKFNRTIAFPAFKYLQALCADWRIDPAWWINFDPYQRCVRPNMHHGLLNRRR
jgi:hypothetical protein